jgi:hypothetical protein
MIAGKKGSVKDMIDTKPVAHARQVNTNNEVAEKVNRLLLENEEDQQKLAMLKKIQQDLNSK